MSDDIVLCLREGDNPDYEHYTVEYCGDVLAVLWVCRTGGAPVWKLMPLRRFGGIIPAAIRWTDIGDVPLTELVKAGLVRWRMQYGKPTLSILAR